MIGGNIVGQLQIKTTVTNEIGEGINTWNTVDLITGFLDLMSGDSKYLNHNTKLQESTHVFICDYKKLNVKAENSRMIINDNIYDITLIDNPMELNQHLEIYLKYIGG